MYKGNILYLNRWVAAGIKHQDDLLVENAFPTYSQLEQKLGPSPALIFEYNAMLNAFKKYTQEKIQGRPLRSGIYFKNISIAGWQTCPRAIRKILVGEALTTPHSLQFWQKRFNLTIDVEVWKSAIQATTETRLQVLHWKIIHNIFPTTILLTKMAITKSDICPICMKRDYIEHFFAECPQLQPLWLEVEKTITYHTGQKLKLTTSIILTGCRSTVTTPRESVNIINHLILIAKMCISKYKFGKPYSLLTMFHNQCHLRKIPI